MPRLSARLLSTERAVEKAKPLGPTTEYRVAGVRGLILRVSDRGTKSWVYLFKSPVTSTWRKASLGNYPTIGLQRAKEMALDYLANVRAGVDPLTAPSCSDTSFGALAKEYVEAHRDRHSPAWTKAIEETLARDILPAIGGHRVDAMLRLDVARIIEKVGARGSYASANHALKILRVISRWAVCTGRSDKDPTVAIKKFPSKARERVLTDDEIRVVWNSKTEFRDPFRLLLLLGMRIGEVLNATRNEVDFQQKVWTIPAARTKSRREHRLPLPPLAISILQAAIENTRGPWLFPSPADRKPLRTGSAATALQRLNETLSIDDRFTPHDLRRTCATRLGDLGIPDEIIARILSHAPTSLTGRVYNRANRSAEVKAALDAWAVELANLVGGR